MIRLEDKYALSFLKEDDIASLTPALQTADGYIRNRNGAGNDFTGWIDLPVNYDKDEFARIKAAAKRICETSDALIVIGIGGSYLGAKAAIDFLRSPNYNSIKKNTPDIYFTGNSFSGDDLKEVLDACEGKRVSVNVISKSGTTTESALAFRFIRSELEKRYSREELKERIYCTTDKARGALKNFADAEGYETFVIPDDIGGRFSVLTAVGLLPIAVAGCDIDSLMQGAAAMREQCFADGLNNVAYRYAVLRNAFYNQGKRIEILASYEGAFRSMAEWWKQLYGESEGKDGKGIFPASVAFSTDLHSLGQFIQDGSRTMFETVVRQEKPVNTLTVPFDELNTDTLNYLAGMSMNEINDHAMTGTLLAHLDGGVPNLMLTYDSRCEYTLGEMVYFFELACAASGYILGVNPFDQPGVEDYKRNMFALLGKPGYESQKEELENKMKL
jgi:glucose-6-phosphate isomerase